MSKKSQEICNLKKAFFEDHDMYELLGFDFLTFKNEVHFFLRMMEESFSKKRINIVDDRSEILEKIHDSKQIITRLFDAFFHQQKDKSEYFKRMLEARINRKTEEKKTKNKKTKEIF